MRPSPFPLLPLVMLVVGGGYVSFLIARERGLTSFRECSKMVKGKSTNEQFSYISRSCNTRDIPDTFEFAGPMRTQQMGPQE